MCGVVGTLITAIFLWTGAGLQKPNGDKVQDGGVLHSQGEGPQASCVPAEQVRPCPNLGDGKRGWVAM